jgi:hypothetical protein
MQAAGCASVVVALICAVLGLPIKQYNGIQINPPLVVTNALRAGAGCFLIVLNLIFWVIFFVVFHENCEDTGRLRCDNGGTSMADCGMAVGLSPIIFMVTTVLSGGLVAAVLFLYSSPLVEDANTNVRAAPPENIAADADAAHEMVVEPMIPFTSTPQPRQRGLDDL